MQVSQKQAARTAEQGRNHVHRSSQPFQSRASPLQPVQQQQQEQQQPQWARSGAAKQDGGANDYRQQSQHMQQPPTAQHAQCAWPQRDDNSTMASSQDVADGQAPLADGKGLKATGGERMAAVLASDVPAAHQGRQAQQVKLFLLHHEQHVVQSFRNPLVALIRHSENRRQEPRHCIAAPRLYYCWQGDRRLCCSSALLGCLPACTCMASW